jgi:hypothetical protein
MSPKLECEASPAAINCHAPRRPQPPRVHQSKSVAYLVSVVSKPELWKPWANDAESFERAVLADLEQSMGGHTPELMREPAGREFRAARLDGSYPNTEIVVNHLDLNTGHVKETRFPVWKEGWGPSIRKENFDPQSVALEIWDWLIEPL